MAATEQIKIILMKNFSLPYTNGGYTNSLDSFIYEFGCITGYELKIDYSKKDVLCYSCLHERNEGDIHYLREKWLQEIKNNHNVTVMDDLDLSGEMQINF